MTTVFLKILNMSISAGWLILAVTLARALMRRCPKYIRCILWGIVAVRLLCPFSIESALSLLPSGETVRPEILYEESPKVDSGVDVVDRVINPVLAESLSPAPGASVNPLQIWTAVASFIWVIGIAVIVFYVVFSYWRLYWRVQASVEVSRDFQDSCRNGFPEKLQDGKRNRDRYHIWLCDEIDTPFILGVFRPVVYLPSRLEKEQAGYVIAHEQTHLKRGDHIWKLVGFLLVAVYWFHPLIWLGYLLFSKDVELACDERTVHTMELEERKAYAAALLVCSVGGKRVLSCPLAFGEVGVKERIKNVLNYKKAGLWVVLAAVIFCMIVAVCFLTDPKREEQIQTASENNREEMQWDAAEAGEQETRDERISGTDTNAEMMRIDLPAPAECILPQMQSYTGMDAYNFLLYLPLTASFDYVDLGLDSLLLLITDEVYEDGDAQCATACDVYYLSYNNMIPKTNYLGTIRSGGTAYPISSDGVSLYAADGHGIIVYDFDQAGQSMTERYVSEAEADHNSVLTSYENSKVISFVRKEDSSVPSTPLEDAVYRSIPWEEREEVDYSTVSLVTLGTEEEGDTVTWYGMVRQCEFSLRDKIEEVGGYHMAMAFTFDVSDGKYVLMEIWRPGEGSYYVENIRERFPEEIAEDALNTQKYMYQQNLECYEQLIQFKELEVDEETQIKMAEWRELMWQMQH